MRKDNRGFTLLELLVAMIILAIIVVPLLRAFVISANTNAKARRNLNASTLGEDITEGIKATPIDQLSYEFNYPSISFNLIDKSMVLGTPEELVFDGTNYQSAASVSSSSITSPDGGITWEFVGQPSGTYYYYLQDMKMQNTNYDALITVDAAPYRSGGTATNLFNDEEVSAIKSVQGANNGFYIQPLNKDIAMLNTMKTDIDYAALTENDLYREIRLVISQSLVGLKMVTTVKAEYIYTGKLAGKPDKVMQDESIIFDNQVSQKNLDNIYLFYTPLYKSQAGSVKDKITVVNPGDVPVNVYLVKQETSVPGTLQTNEGLYKMDIVVDEGDGVTVKPSAVTKIRTNIDMNLASVYIPACPVSVNQATYKYNTATNQVVAKAKLDKKDLSASQKMDRIFNIKVEIFKEGCHVGGSYTFAGDKKIYEITGSTED